MTLSEFEHKLKAMPPAEKAKLLKDLGNLEEDRCLETFATNPRWELKICRMLGVTPQSEKVGKATCDAARYAKLGFLAALVVILISALSLYKAFLH
ncbi:MAG: hypothetical protein ACXVBB_13875 [Isosphaeraceae bacterium]